jgi:hypothetical protein
MKIINKNFISEYAAIIVLMGDCLPREQDKKQLIRKEKNQKGRIQKDAGVFSFLEA